MQGTGGMRKDSYVEAFTSIASCVYDHRGRLSKCVVEKQRSAAFLIAGSQLHKLAVQQEIASQCARNGKRGRRKN
jgi:hypothetical protein